MKTLITGGRVIDPASQLDINQSVYIDNGKIVAISDYLADFQNISSYLL